MRALIPSKLTSLKRFSLTRLLALSFCVSALTTLTLAPQQAEAKKHRLAKGLSNRLKGGNGYGLLGVKLSGMFAGIDAERTGAQDPLINNPESLLSFGVGLTLDRSINSYVGWRAEVMWQNKNFSHNSPEDYNLKANPTKVESETYLDYLEVPVGLVIHIQPGHLIQPYVSVGGYGAFLIKADGKHTGLGANDEARTPFSSIDYGYYLSAGAWFVLAEGAGFLGAELKYSMGMANVADTEVEVEGASGKLTPLDKQTYDMGNFNLSVSYYF